MMKWSVVLWPLGLWSLAGAAACGPLPTPVAPALGKLTTFERGQDGWRLRRCEIPENATRGEVREKCGAPLGKIPFGGHGPDSCTIYRNYAHALEVSSYPAPYMAVCYAYLEVTKTPEDCWPVGSEECRPKGTGAFDNFLQAIYGLSSIPEGMVMEDAPPPPPQPQP